MNNVYYVILAGGSGSRLWPISRSNYPKHLLDLRGKGSMLRETVNRIKPLAKPNQILIITEKTHSQHIRKQIPEIPPENFIIEPARKETGPCIALAASVIEKRNPKAIMVSLHSDHFIKDIIKFRLTLKTAIALAEKTQKLITLGIYPTYPETSFGYIETQQKISSKGHFTLFSVNRFTEKPDEATAQAFIASGKYFWNSGIFIWTVKVILQEFQNIQPEFFAKLTKIQNSSLKTNKDKIYISLPVKAIEYLILEKSQNVAVIPVDFGWSDIGSFKAVKDILTNYPEENLICGKHVTVGSSGCFIYSPKKMVATIGLNNMVIVETDDILLVCPKDRSQDVKKIVLQLKKAKKTRYL